MKKNRIYGLMEKIGLFKMIKIMRFTIFILFISLSQTFAVNSYSQQAKLSLDMRNARVEDIIDKIEKNSEFFFMYNKNIIDVDRKVDIQVEEKSVSEVLDKIFANTGITYSIKDRQILLINNRTSDAGTQSIAQQQKSISGKVTDSSGAPLPGVTVVVKGTTTGNITDSNGNFMLSNVTANSTLVFSFVGMKSQEVQVAGKVSINIVMNEEAIGLDEVVAVGYGTAKKSDLTGSIVSVDMEKKEMSANINLAQALQGYIAGVNVGGSSKAGETGDISIRGKTSLSANDNPLIVLDGIIFNGSMADVDVNDIEKVDILKDASATAVYGSRSANGVIIITTKKGRSEKPLFNFNMYYGFQDISPTKRTDLMNGDEYAIRLVDYYYYQQKLLPWYKTNPTSIDGRPVRPDITDRALVAKSLRSMEEQENYLAGKEVNWIDLVTSTAPIQSYNLSVSGKTDRTNYYLSGSYIDQNGIIKNDDFSRVSLRANFENKITDWFTVGMNTSFSRLDYSGYYNNSETVSNDGFYNPAAMSYTLLASPLANITNAEGKYPIFLTGESYMRHPLINSYIDDLDIANNVFVVLTAKIDIPYVKGLRYELNYSETFDTRKQNNFFPTSTYEGSTYNNYGRKIHNEEHDWLANNILSYNRTFNEKHNLNATLLYSSEKKQAESSTLIAYGFQNPLLGYNSLQLGENKSVSTSAWEEASISYMARANYVYNNRYMLTATYRRDGYSGFGKNTKYAGFPSISAGWVASEESFLDGIGWLDYLKLRASYGLNGNQGIGRYSSLSKMTSAATVFGSTSAVGVYPSTLGNANLGWESTASANIGLDFKVLNQRISGEIDAYSARTKDVLVQRTLPESTGYDNVWTNIGGIKNQGIEVGLTTINVKQSTFSWQSRFLFSINRDEITKLYGGNNDKDLGNSWFVGEPISAQYNYQVDGVWQEQDLFNGNIYAGYYPGMYKLRDLNGDKIIDATNDREIVGYSAPNYRFGINNTLNYKGFTLSIFLNSIQGGNGYFIANNYGAVVAGGTDYEYRVNRPGVRSYWRPDNAVNNAPAMYYAPPQSHAVYEDKSFIRLQDVSLSYDVNKRNLSLIGLSSLQIYVSGKNLYTWTEWSGWDPEDNNSPMMRSVIAGVRLSF